MKRIDRERRVVAMMIEMYCHSHHGIRQGTCAQCSQLLNYALTRLARCPQGDGKRSCRKCPVHCYRSDRREQIREVMRYAGPRMLWTHPGDALVHLYYELR